MREQAGWWTAHANLRFNFNDAPGAEIRISFDPNDGAWSYVGTDCRGIPLNEATMNLGFMDGGTTAHEFGHAIGLAHEHQNPAGGIEWNEEVVIRELARPPNLWDEATARHNVLRKYSADQINGTRFDPDLDHAVFLPRRMDTQWHRHQGQRSAVGPRQDVRRRREDVSADRSHGGHANRARGRCHPAHGCVNWQVR